MLEELEPVLLERRKAGEISALIIDEAQSLGSEILEEIRLLANIETPTQKLLPLVLSGQPELAERLEESGLRQLKQRVALRCEISAFDVQETAGYISSRIQTAGGHAARLFTREAVLLIHEHSRGIPRTISVICDNALVTGMALGRRPVDREIVLDVCRDFWLRGEDGLGPSADAAAPSPAAASVAPPEPPLPDVSAAPANATGEESSRRRRFSLFGSGRQ
jgi:general secretion pathway protein A